MSKSITKRNLRASSPQRQRRNRRLKMERLVERQRKSGIPNPNHLAEKRAARKKANREKRRRY